MTLRRPYGNVRSFKFAVSLAAVATLIGTSPLSIPFAAAAQAAPYVKVCNSGDNAGSGVCPANPVLGPGQSQWACTWDIATGLLWEVKVPSLTDLRGFRKTYTNYDDITQPQRNGTRPTIAQVNGPSNSVGFVQAVNAAGLCNQHDWKRPTLVQLGGIIYPSGAPFKLDTAFFPEPTFKVAPIGQTSPLLTYPNEPVLTETGMPGRPSYYQSIRFFTGTAEPRARPVEALIRLVSRRCPAGKPC